MRLKALRSSREDFTFPHNRVETEAMLLESVKFQVSRRGGYYKPDNDSKKAISAVADWLTSPKKTCGLMLLGFIGNGKTTIMRAVVDMINACGLYDRQNRQVWVNWIDAKALARHARDDEAYMYDLIKRPMIALDDIGTEASDVKAYGNVINPVVDLLEYRYREQLFTMVTTNLSPEKICATYGERIADRLNEMMTQVVIERGSYR